MGVCSQHEFEVGVHSIDSVFKSASACQKQICKTFVQYLHTVVWHFYDPYWFFGPFIILASDLPISLPGAAHL